MTEAERVDAFNRILDQELVFKLFFKPAEFFLDVLLRIQNDLLILRSSIMLVR